MEKNDINAELERVMELPAGSIKGNTVLSDMQWDSMSAIMFIAMADEKFGAKINLEKLSEAKTIQDLHSLILAN